MDYLALEPLIVQRLEAKVPGIKAVLPAANLDGIVERSQVEPAIHVVYQGSRLPIGDGFSADGGRDQMAFQRWLIVVVVRSVAGDQSGVATRTKAGPLVGDALEALQGFGGIAPFRPLRRVSEPAPLFRNGFGYFPNLFENSVFVSGLED